MGCAWLTFHNAASGRSVHRVITELSDRTRKQSRQPRAEIASIFHKEITRRLGFGRVSFSECEKDLAGRDTPAKSFRRSPVQIARRMGL
jgi:hypothetical protein